MKTLNLIRSFDSRIGSKVRVKAFKNSDNMYKFLNSGSNALKWREVEEVEQRAGLNRGGMYIDRGGEYLNVKSIDPSALAHMGGW